MNLVRIKWADIFEVDFKLQNDTYLMSPIQSNFEDLNRMSILKPLGFLALKMVRTVMVSNCSAVNHEVILR